MVALHVAAAPVEICQHPPAIVRSQFLAVHFQMLPATRRMAVLPQNVHRYLSRIWISYFFTIFLRDAPYLVPYLPVMPTFLVCLVIAATEPSGGQPSAATL